MKKCLYVFSTEAIIRDLTTQCGQVWIESIGVEPVGMKGLQQSWKIPCTCSLKGTMKVPMSLSASWHRVKFTQNSYVL